MRKQQLIATFAFVLLSTVQMAHAYELSNSQEDRIVSQNDTHTTFICPYDDNKQFTIYMESDLLDDAYFQSQEELDCKEYTVPGEAFGDIIDSIKLFESKVVNE